MRFQLDARPAVYRSIAGTRQPGVDRWRDLVRFDVVDEVVQQQDTARLERLGDPLQSDRLPEVRQVMERIAQ